jgi:hypothetical protein
MTAASRQSGAEGPDGSVGLKVMPIDNVTLRDAYDPGERAQSRRSGTSSGRPAGRSAPNVNGHYVRMLIRCGQVVMCPAVVP